MINYMSNELKPCVSRRQNVIMLYIAINISTTQHFPTVFIVHDLQYLVNKCVQLFL